MKKVFSVLVALLAFCSCDKYNHEALENEVNDLKSRVAALEEWAETVNSNISALQSLVATLQNGDYVTGVSPFSSPAPGGYIISFVNSGNIVISNGTDGKNGAGRKDGVNGKDGANGRDGADGKNGADGQDGQNGSSPQLRINSSNIWEVSYNSGVTWTSLGVPATGGDGHPGRDGITPMIRINAFSNEWEISMDSGVSWMGTGTVASGDKGEKGDAGDAVFAAGGVDFSNAEYVELTLVDGTVIRLPKYKKLGLYYTQPGIFAAGETKIISYTPEGNVAAVRFVDVPDGWRVSVNQAARTFTVTAPESGRGGEATILVSDNDQEMIVRTVNFISNAGDNTGGGDDGGDDGGGDGGGDNPGGGGDDGGNTGNGGNITVDGYSGNSLTLYYSDNMSEVISKSAGNVFVAPANSKIIKNIVLEGGLIIIAGRKADGSDISLKISGGDLVLRDNGTPYYIPIGTYSEFQLIRTKLDGNYKQEASIDLLNIEWAPVGNFGGSFDGNGYTLANLKISGNNDNAGGICGYGYYGYGFDPISNCSNGSDVSGRDNVGGISGNGIADNCHNTGSVSGTNRYVGGICGYGSASGCYNTGSVSGSDRYIGGICGSGYASNCYNTGSISGAHYIGGICGISIAAISTCYNAGFTFGSGNYIGGICGSSESYSIAACYNTANISGGDHYIGGISGNSTSTISSCYSIGAVSGNGVSIGGICGRISGSGSVTACYWKDIPGDKAAYGTGSSSSNADAGIFAAGVWPSSAEWGSSNWKTLGSWNDGNPVYPRLAFED